jgi:hypothetical protein
VQLKGVVLCAIALAWADAGSAPFGAYGKMPLRGIDSATVPGAVDGEAIGW